MIFEFFITVIFSNFFVYTLLFVKLKISLLNSLNIYIDHYFNRITGFYFIVIFFNIFIFKYFSIYNVNLLILANILLKTKLLYLNLFNIKIPKLRIKIFLLKRNLSFSFILLIWLIFCLSMSFAVLVKSIITKVYLYSLFCTIIFIYKFNFIIVSDTKHNLINKNYSYIDYLLNSLEINSVIIFFFIYLDCKCCSSFLLSNLILKKLENKLESDFEWWKPYDTNVDNFLF